MSADLGDRLVFIAPPVMLDDGEVIHLFHPRTGKEVSFSADDAELGEYLAAVKDLENETARAKRMVWETLLSRMDKRGSWTVHAGPISLTGEAPGKVEYDGERLHLELEVLAEEGLIDPDAAKEAVKSKVEWKPAVLKIKGLAKLGGDVAAAIERCAIPTDPSKRRVTVTRKAG